MKNALILLAGGNGKRFGTKDPKQFININGNNLIEYLLSKLDNNIFDLIIIATKESFRKKYLYNIGKKYIKHNILFSESGSTRQESSKKALSLLNKHKPHKVLIHDSARPLATNKLFKKILKKLDKYDSSIPYVKYSDLIISKKNILLQRNDIYHIQTPQGFRFKKIYKAHMHSKIVNSADDSTLLKEFGFKINKTIGEITNIKITKKNDYKIFQQMKINEYRSGIGYDIHKIDFNSNKKLMLCGIEINHLPLLGHSDADVGYHAICDSILGSLSMKDIGYYFNNKNKKWKNANSEIFLQYCLDKLFNKKYKIVNLDINFICETPNINKLRHKMIKKLSSILKISPKNISIKATTNEKIGLIGRGEGIAAESIVQIVNV